MKTMEGTLLLVQESRFQLADDGGVAHLFILGANAGAEPAQLAALQPRQARLRVSYSEPRNVIGNLAHSIAVVGE